MLKPAFLQDFANIVIRVTHVGFRIFQNMPHAAERHVRLLRHELDPGIDGPQDRAGPPRPQTSHGTDQRALARPGLTFDQHLLAWRDDEIGMVDDEIPVRLRDGKIPCADSHLGYRQARLSCRARRRCVRRRSSARKRAPRRAVPRHSIPRAGSSYRRAKIKATCTCRKAEASCINSPKVSVPARNFAAPRSSGMIGAKAEFPLMIQVSRAC
jgi:hypothetical protein